MSKKKDNVIAVIEKAISFYKIKVSKSGISEFLKSHPHYPSLKSVCDALKDWKIEHYPLKLEIEEIKDLDMPFIAHLGVSDGLFAFVEEFNQ